MTESHASPLSIPGEYPASGMSMDRKREGLAIPALVLSVVGVPITFLAFVGLALGIVALKRINRDGTRGRGLAIAAIVIGGWMSVAFVLALIGLAIGIANSQ